MRVLIIEDDAIIGTDLEIASSDMGFSDIAFAMDEAEAIAMGKIAPPDLIISDIRLGSSGSGVRAVNEILRAAGAAVVFVTGLMDADEMDQSGGVVALGKPWNATRLQMAISQTVKQPAGVTVAWWR
ncbi:response regulator [Methylocystis echinoides]|jgi:ActR/RegA family two-component response regulator|uniref:response regulator n=1 Tax=Methylocystis echinoides TaxID=29468 RepID=UPI00343C0C6A